MLSIIQIDSKALALSKREGGEVDVAAGEDYAELWRGGVAAGREVEGGYGAGLEERGDGYGGGWLDDDFHALPDGAHGGDDFFFAGEQDALDVVAQDGEGARGERGAQAVGEPRVA